MAAAAADALMPPAVVDARMPVSAVPVVAVAQSVAAPVLAVAQSVAVPLAAVALSVAVPLVAVAAVQGAAAVLEHS
jgi:hypothetical protein